MVLRSRVTIANHICKSYQKQTTSSNTRNTMLVKKSKSKKENEHKTCKLHWGTYHLFHLGGRIRRFLCFASVPEYGVSFTHMYALDCVDVVGNKVEKLCDLCSITLNKNAVFGDSSALSPGGVRIGKYLIIIFFFIFL